MKLVLDQAQPLSRAGEPVAIRLTVLNDSFEPIVIDRRLLVGPNLVPGTPTMPQPVELEPAFAEEEQNRVVLNPWCYYGRERSFSGLEAGPVRLHGYLLKWPADALLATGPVDPEALLSAAQPLELAIEH